jgi:hypothetical protein
MTYSRQYGLVRLPAHDNRVAAGDTTEAAKIVGQNPREPAVIPNNVIR